MGWIAYVVAWLVSTLLWAVAAATAGRLSPLQTLPYGLLAMGSAAIMGVAIWRLTGRVEWNWRSVAFYAAHTIALTIFTLIYSISWAWPDFVRGRFSAAFEGVRHSPVLGWNLLIGCWLYLLIAGLSYAIRANRRARAQEVAAGEARLLAQQAQLVALRAQINPHFLFNALHSVGALVSTDPARADEALECLGDLLRYALGTEHEVLLAQEWAFTTNYLSFEQLRLGERLRVDAHADADALSVMVPPLILQPIVENAVRHGIADRAEGGRIMLRAHLENDRLLLRVTDDGRGAKGAGDGLGLTSVRRRLAALYGDQATVAIDSSAAGCTVSIVLPANARDLGSAA
jgi:two-component system, LytTR family, sensor kinase